MRVLLISLITLFFSTFSMNALGADFNPDDIFISCVGTDSVYKITAEGSISTFATGLYDPVGLSFSPKGQLFVVERGTGEITNITAGGDFTGAVAHAWGFDIFSLRNLLIDKTGRMLVADRNQGTVVDVTDGGLYTPASIFASGLSGTRDIFQTSTGKIYVVEEFSGEVTDITAGGNFTTATPFASGFSVPYALAESPDNHLYLTESQSGNVFDITAGGSTHALFASNLGVVDEIIFNKKGTFLLVQEYLNTIVDISGGGSGPFPIVVSGLGQYPQQIALPPSSASLSGSMMLLLTDEE